MKSDWEAYADAAITFLDEEIGNSLYIATTNNRPRVPDEPISLDTIAEQIRGFEKVEPIPKISYTVNAVEPDYTRRMFPESKHRSARIRKKLIKRFGSEFGWKPVILKLGRNIFAHPSFREIVERG